MLYEVRHPTVDAVINKKTKTVNGTIIGTDEPIEMSLDEFNDQYKIPGTESVTSDTSLETEQGVREAVAEAEQIVRDIEAETTAPARKGRKKHHRATVAARKATASPRKLTATAEKSTDEKRLRRKPHEKGLSDEEVLAGRAAAKGTNGTSRRQAVHA